MTVVGQDARLTFSGTAGQRVSLAVTNVTNPTAYVYLVKPDGTNQTSISISTGCNPCFMDTQTLGTSGTYTLWVQHFSTYVGSETLQLNNDSDVTGTITPGGSAVTVTTTVMGQDARLTFSGTAGQRVSLAVTNVTNPTAYVYLVKPDGTNQTNISINAGCNPCFMDVQTLGATG